MELSLSIFFPSLFSCKMHKAQVLGSSPNLAGLLHFQVLMLIHFHAVLLAASLKIILLCWSTSSWDHLWDLVLFKGWGPGYCTVKTSSAKKIRCISSYEPLKQLHFIQEMHMEKNTQAKFYLLLKLWWLGRIFWDWWVWG